jgi:hypothetical protein
VLGVPSTIPEWVESDLKKIVTKYQLKTIDEDSLKALQQELKDAGLEEMFSEAIASLARSLPQK